MVSVSAFVKKHEDRLILAAAGLVVLITILLVAFITIDVISGNPAASDQGMAHTASQNGQQETPASPYQAGKLVQKFTQLNIFGQQKQAPKPRKTRLRLSLHGIVNADNPDTSVVIISAGETSPENAYRIGDKLPGGATLTEVYADHIVLLNNDTREVLNLLQTALKPAEASISQ